MFWLVDSIFSSVAFANSIFQVTLMFHIFVNFVYKTETPLLKLGPAALELSLYFCIITIPFPFQHSFTTAKHERNFIVKSAIFYCYSFTVSYCICFIYISIPVLKRKNHHPKSIAKLTHCNSLYSTEKKLWNLSTTYILKKGKALCKDNKTTTIRFHNIKGRHVYLESLLLSALRFYQVFGLWQILQYFNFLSGKTTAKIANS